MAPLSPAAALVTLLKGMIGAGVLSLPYTFGKVRLGTAIPGMVLLGILCFIGIWRLIECTVKLTAQDSVAPKPGHDQAQDRNASRGCCFAYCGSSGQHDPVSLVDYDCDDDTSPPGLANDWGLGPVAAITNSTFGHGGLAVAAVALLSVQMGTCVCYIDVITETVYEQLDGAVSMLAVHGALFVILCILCLVRELSDIAWLSGVALAVYCYIVYELVAWGSQELENNSTAKGAEWSTYFWPVRYEGLTAFLGTMIFAFEGITIAQYVYVEMQSYDPGPFWRVLVGSSVICAAFYGFVGVFGYLCYGDKVQQLIYSNFPEDSASVECVKWVLCLVLVLSFALQMYPVFSFAESVCLCVSKDKQSDSLEFQQGRQEGSGQTEGQGGGRFPSLFGAAVRWAIIALVFLVTALIPGVVEATEYVGSFSYTTLGFLIPPIVHMKVFGASLSPVALATDILLVIVGLAVMFLAVGKLLGVEGASD